MNKSLVMTFAGMLAFSSQGGVDANTIAFYPCSQGDDGDSIVGITLTNVVDVLAYPGRASADASGATLSSDVPGRYLVTGYGTSGEHVWSADARSVSVGSTGSVDFSGLASAISKMSAWTIECFVKVADSEFANWGTMMEFDAGYANQVATGPLEVLSILSGGVYKMRLRIGSSYPTDYLINKDYRNAWRHLAFSGNSEGIKFYYDYDRVVTMNLGSPSETAEKALRFLRCGKFFGLRVSNVVRETSAFLRAYDNLVSIDAPLEGTVGSAVEDDCAWSDANGKKPTYASLRGGYKVYSGGALVGTNLTAVRLEVLPKTSASQTFASGTALRFSVAASKAVTESFTMETFLRFNRGEWERKVLNHVVEGESETRPRFTLVGREWSSSARDFTWCAFVKYNWKTGYRLWFEAVLADANANGGYRNVEVGGDASIALDGKWHRYVVAYDNDSRVLKIYEDETLLLEQVLDAPLATLAGTAQTYDVGRGCGNHPLEGFADCVRLTRTLLPVSEFLRMEKIPQGLMIMVQ